jgi:Tfp pilus assembly protein PilV
VPLTSLTSANPQLGFARVNVLVSFLVSCVVAVLSLVQFGAREVRFENLEFRGSDRSDR